MLRISRAVATGFPHSEDIQKEFPRNSGFSYANLDRMRKFHLTYKDNPKLAQLVREIPWGQNITILEKLKDNYQREYICE